MKAGFFTLAYCLKSERLIEYPTTIGRHWREGRAAALWQETRGRYWRERRDRPSEGIGLKEAIARFRERAA
jgi:hypothetical protein